MTRKMTTSLASRQLTRALETANIVDRARIGEFATFSSQKKCRRAAKRRSSRRDPRLIILYEQAIRCRNVRLERRPRRLSEIRILYRNQATSTIWETLLRCREQQTVSSACHVSRDHQDSDTRVLGP